MTMFQFYNVVLYYTTVLLLLCYQLSPSYGYMVNIKNNNCLVYRNNNKQSSLSSTMTNNDNNIMIQNAKKNLIQTCQELKDEYGIFIFDKSSKDRFKSSLMTFERQTETTMMPISKDMVVGEWELLCTTSISNDGLSIPDIFNQGPFKDIRESITKTTNKYWKVEQHINYGIDRIDHIVTYNPPSELKDMIDNLPEQLTSLNINPLQVSTSKLSLVHKASVIDDNDKLLKIQLSLSKIVLNVAGRSTILDPAGKDIAEFPIPLGQFLNGGTFETTYVDDTLRISRGQAQNFLDEQLRVFIKKSTTSSTSSIDVDEFIDPEFDNNNNVDAPSDVEIL